LVFRPFIQIWRTICTLVPFRTSIRISPDFIRFKQSSISFGFHQMCTNTNHLNWWFDLKGLSKSVCLSTHFEFINNSLSLNKIFFFKKKKKTIFLSYIDTCSRLLNPCFKTGLISNSSATNFSVKVFERKKTFFPEEKLHKLKINPQFMRISIEPLRGLLSWVFFNQSFLKTFSGLTFYNQ